MFFITCFYKIALDDFGYFDGGHERTFGFKETLEEAEYALNNNSCDMNECGYYNYAVVEEIHPGIHPIARQEIWFKWDSEKEGFFRMEKPEETVDFINYALG